MTRLVLLLAILFQACAPSNLAEVMKAYGTSERSAYGRVTTVYGSAVVCGTGQVNVTVVCNTEGMTIRALGEAADKALAVPVTIKPIELVPNK
jgi:hypothetical protein